MDERPGLYVRLEVGVSWPRHMNKRRSISYTSPAVKERQERNLLLATPAFNTTTRAHNNDHLHNPDQAYLQHVYNYAAQNDYTRDQSYWQYNHTAAQPRAEAQQPTLASLEQPLSTQTHYVAYHPSYRQQTLYSSQNDHLPRRSRSMSSHNSRGSSGQAYAQTPWDAEPEALGSTALPAKPAPTQRSQSWKPLPATPDHFRLGEDAMPWSGSPDPADYSAVESSRRGQFEDLDALRTGPVDSTLQRSADDRDRGRTVEMQSLATALMTVDNGFEDQWWFQGPRMVTMAGDLIAPASLREVYEQGTSEPREYANSPSAYRFQASTPTSTIVDLVSPLSGFSSPASRQSRQEV